jgi:2-methylisocitrate lyase-like PEP mutase family enzyme
MKRKLHQAVSKEHPGLRLQAELAAYKPIAPFIGVFDLLSATIASRHSFNLFLSGFGFAASHYGLPDLGYISWSDMVDEAWRIGRSCRITNCSSMSMTVMPTPARSAT